MIKVVLRSLRFYWRSCLAVFLGVFLTSAVITGALSVGDSVKATLKGIAGERTGPVQLALLGNDRFFTSQLAGKLGGDGVEAVPVMQVVGTVANETGNARANDVQVIGVPDGFWKMGGSADSVAPADDSVAINQALASQLGVTVGDLLVARVELPGAISKDAPLSGSTTNSVTLRRRVGTIVPVGELGNFSLKAEQTPPLNLFLPLPILAETLEKPGRANLILFTGPNPVDLPAMEEAVDENWTIADASLRVREGKGTLILESDRVLIDDHVGEKARALGKTAGTFTYLINGIVSGEGETPYSMVTAAEDPDGSLLPADLQAREVVVSQWLADDLGISAGDDLALRYYVYGEGRKLNEVTTDFSVRSVASMDHPDMHPDWSPEFPGVSEADNCRDWEPGIPVDLEKIRDKDEDYWDEYKGTPKVFFGLAAGQELWSNRFGNLTSLQFPLADNPGLTREKLIEGLEATVGSSDAGVHLLDVQASSDAAVSQSLDFGALFASMSFFLILAALILTALLFVLGIDQRMKQIGTLVAIGFTRAKVRRLFLLEGGLIALVGSLLGVLGGLFYTKGALWGLSNVWAEAAAGVTFLFKASPGSMLTGALMTFFLALLALYFASRAVLKVQPSRLLSGQVSESETSKKRLSRWLSPSFWLAPVGFLGGLLLLLGGLGKGAQERGMAFFGGAFLLLVGGIALASVLLRVASERKWEKRSLALLGLRNASRRRGRSLAVVIMMAAGVFMITAMNAMRIDPEADSELRSAGTGGFRFVGESTMPISEDLNEASGREEHGLDEEIDFKVVSFRVKDGEDASCLNLNRAQKPRLMAVEPEDLAARNAFTFVQKESGMGDGEDQEAPWLSLNTVFDDPQVIAGVADMNTAMYALHLKVGDTVEYTAENGTTLKVRLVGFLNSSILQGSLIVSRENYVKHFPSVSGYRYFLFDVATESAGDFQKDITRMLENKGLSLTPAPERLAAFGRVQNTYLKIFSTLGGLGLLLGSIGLAVVVVRNILERRGELAAMQAVGFSRQRLRWLVLSEHWFLHLGAVILGFVAAMVAIAPALFTAQQGFPLGLLLLLVGVILLGGLAFCWLAAAMTLRGPLLNSLRSE
ncbi:MAG: FtsX-like permease family protein [Verrucomicrobiota bacterium]